MVRHRNESGLTVTEWCKQNGINLKTECIYILCGYTYIK